MLGTIPMLCQQRDWVGGVRKTANLSDVKITVLLMLMFGWVGGSEKVLK